MKQKFKYIKCFDYKNIHIDSSYNEKSRRELKSLIDTLSTKIRKRIWGITRDIEVLSPIRKKQAQKEGLWGAACIKYRFVWIYKIRPKTFYHEVGHLIFPKKTCRYVENWARARLYRTRSRKE